MRDATIRIEKLTATAVKGFATEDVEHLDLRSDGIVGNREFFFVDDTGQSFSVSQSPCFLRFSASYDNDARLLQIRDGGTAILQGTTEPDPEVRPLRVDHRHIDGHLVPGPWDDFASDLAGQRLRLARGVRGAAGFDGYPVTVHSTASLAALGSDLDGAVMNHQRFRMSITISGVDEPYTEDTWEGRT